MVRKPLRLLLPTAVAARIENAMTVMAIAHYVAKPSVKPKEILNCIPRRLWERVKDRPRINNAT
jgi:hypothetical protein